MEAVPLTRVVAGIIRARQSDLNLITECPFPEDSRNY